MGKVTLKERPPHVSGPAQDGVKPASPVWDGLLMPEPRSGHCLPRPTLQGTQGCTGELALAQRKCRWESGAWVGTWGRGDRPPDLHRPTEKIKLHIYLFAHGKGQPLRGDI